MKKYILILAAFLPLYGFGQWLYPTGDPTAIVTQNNSYVYFNSLEKGNVLLLPASKILASNLTYNSSGLTVSYASANRVKLTGTTNVRVGNSVRFGSPTTGTIYQIQSISTDTLTLDQTFTGSVSDEFYWGGIGSFLDLSGNSNDAWQSTATYQPKKIIDSIRFDGTDDFLYLPDVDNMSFGNGTTDSPFSVSAWVKSSDTDGYNIISRYTPDNTYREWRVATITGGELICGVYDNSASAYLAKRNYFIPSDNKWHHIIMTYDGSNTIAGIKVYADGVLKTMTNLTGGTYVAMENTPTYGYIGGKSLNAYLNGMLGDIRVYARVLTSYEITQLYRTAKYYGK